MTTAHLDLRGRQNPGCLSCDRMARNGFLENGLCKQTVSVLDDRLCDLAQRLDRPDLQP